MSSEQAWSMIVNNLIEREIELPTVPKTKKIPVWFTASTSHSVILINKALHNKPSSKLTMTRSLQYKTFEKVYPYYLRREKGDQVSAEVTAITVNSVYYYSLIKHFCK